MAWKEKKYKKTLHKHPYTSNMEDRWKMESPTLETNNTTEFLTKYSVESHIWTPNSDNRAFCTFYETFDFWGKVLATCQN